MENNLENNIRVTGVGKNKGSLLIPFDGPDFAEFISSLLGKKESTEISVRGIIDITKENIVNFHHMIVQRVENQNAGLLVDFSCKVTFNDRSTINLPGIESLLTYNDIRSRVSKSVSLSWIFLIKFATKHIPERQEINIYINTDLGSEDMPSYIKEYTNHSGSIEIFVSHTDRTWGYDIAHMLQANAKGFITEENKLLMNMRNYSKVFSSFFASIMLTPFLMLIFIHYHQASIKKIEDVKNYLSKYESPARLIQESIPFFLSPWEADLPKAVIIFSASLGLFMVALFIALYIRNIILKVHPSFLVMTPTSEKYRTREIDKFRKSIIKMASAVIGTFIIGLATNFAYDYLKISYYLI